MRDVEITRPSQLAEHLSKLNVSFPSSKLVRAMMAQRGERVRRSIRMAYGSDSQAPDALEYLTALCFACSPLVVDHLEKNGVGACIATLPLVADDQNTYASFCEHFERARQGVGDGQENLLRLLQSLDAENSAEKTIDHVGLSRTGALATDAMNGVHGVADRLPPPVGDANLPELTNVAEHRPPTTQAALPIRKSYHVYGGSGAACFSFSLVDDLLRVNLEGASGQSQVYDWGRKINIELNNCELPMLLALLLGKIDKVEGSAHGAQRDKGFSIENQTTHYYISIRKRDVPSVSVKMAHTDAFWVSLLLQSFLCKSLMVSEGILINCINSMAEKINAASKK